MSLYLCEDCLDAFASNYFEHDTPPEVAVVNFATRELRPLEGSCPWFTFDNYLVDCTFEDTGKIDLRITYRPVRYQEDTEIGGSQLVKNIFNFHIDIFGFGAYDEIKKS